jgi:hypothetical protein
MFIHLAIGWMTFLTRTLPKVTVDWGGVSMLLLCVFLAGAVGHNFCAWLWKGSGREGAWRLKWTAMGLAGVVLLFAAGTAFTGVTHQVGWLLRSEKSMFYNTGRAVNDRNASASLMTLTSAQADFRANDRDGNQINDFWRGDVAGLYFLKLGSEPIKLIEQSVALADVAPRTEIPSFLTRSPKSGYHFKALRFRDENDVSDPQRFAFVAYPSVPQVGKWIFIVSPENTVYRRSIVAGPVPDIYPDDPLKEGWSKLD